MFLSDHGVTSSQIGGVKLVAVACVCGPSNLEAEAGGSREPTHLRSAGQQ
jgi:hypothetical protein